MKYQSKNSALCRDFAQQAISTWIRLQNSTLTGLTFDEETVTDINLQDLQLKHPYQIRTVKFNKQAQEPLNGADWEWWLLSGSRGLGLRIQAKKINLTSLLYPSVNKTNKNGRQIDLLIEDANRQQPQLIPLYAFYNFIDTNTNNLPWNCFSFPVDLQKLGCSIVPATILRQMNIDNIGINDIKNIMLPWHCLVCCGGYIDRSAMKTGEDKLPDRAFSFINNSFKRLANTPDTRDLQIPTLEKSSYVTEKLPNYILELRESGKIENTSKEIQVGGIMLIDEK